MFPFKKRLSLGTLSRGSLWLEFQLNNAYLLRWLVLALVVGVLAGSASALFLWLLDWATAFRETHLWIIAFLPVAGFLIGWLYHRWGKEAEAGNNAVLRAIQQPAATQVPLIMAPLVLVATILTHLVGGSAGREGTAAQMGGALADQVARLFRLRPRYRQLLLICGLSAGFSSVFGTPLAGAIFGVEVFLLGHLRYQALLPSLLAALIAHVVTTAWGIEHTLFPVVEGPTLTGWTLGATLLAGICFGLAARLFSWATQAVSHTFKTTIAYPPLRPVVGGVLLVLVVWGLGTTKYIGLGIPTIEQAFVSGLPPYDFLLKLALTALTLGCGFKGGEVTPLFFIGATLGNALFPWFPLPLEVFVALGFVAVFAGASNTPLACSLMAMELFGAGIGVYAALACGVAYLFSGHSGIYGAQVVATSKNPYYAREAGTRLAERKRRFL
ncbi:chloride channel protein [Rufibacter glacialis]|uniref:Chloride channel protein n=1 Tax=Rufibacter glacialis TaxID=1259555 RepID=A0A5M8QEE2_9BACT|nr:chloride channel protein [Rufibacter glacialis]KAA6434379.1 chloride channel protein [Rufibacter glacialis]GGK69024.1 voltage-gated chloride channel protein [Rufibacter glacialis]